MNRPTIQFNFETNACQQWHEFLQSEREKTFTLNQILSQINITPDKIFLRDKSIQLSQTAYCYSTNPGSIAFAGNVVWLNMAMASSSVSCIFTNWSSLNVFKGTLTKTTIVGNDSAEWFHLLHNKGIHKTCYPNSGNTKGFISPKAHVDQHAIIRGPVYIDDDVVVGPQTVITGPCYIGPESRIEECVSLGTKGIFAKKVDRVLRKFEYYGGVSIGRNSHIHARANIAASPHFRSFSTVGNNVSIGIYSNLGHDTIVQDNTTIASTACVCGHAVVGKNCWIGAGSIIRDGCCIGDNANVRIGSVVIEDVEDGADISGNFAVAHKKNLREYMKRK